MALVPSNSLSRTPLARNSYPSRRHADGARVTQLEGRETVLPLAVKCPPLSSLPFHPLPHSSPTVPKSLAFLPPRDGRVSASSSFLDALAPATVPCSLPPSPSPPSWPPVTPPFPTPPIPSSSSAHFHLVPRPYFACRRDPPDAPVLLARRHVVPAFSILTSARFFNDLRPSLLLSPTCVCEG